MRSENRLDNLKATAPHGTRMKYSAGCRCDACYVVEMAAKAAYRAKNLETLRANDRAYYQRTREARLAYQKRYREANRDKRNAQHKLYRAVKTGKITRPDRCERCFAVGQVDGHHADYSQPLAVEWLCESCHISEHQNRSVARTLKAGRWGL